MRLPATAMPLLVTGVLGGFTTFSAFSLDALRLIEGGRPGAAALYVSGSVGLSLLACAAGLWIGRLG
jgi:CrcB protein